MIYGVGRAHPGDSVHARDSTMALPGTTGLHRKLMFLSPRYFPKTLEVTSLRDFRPKG